MKHNMHKLKKEPNDEYYTLYNDIEDELINFKNELKDKIIYCNCDNPKFSNFYKFFEKEIINYGIKEVIFTFYNKEKNTIKTTLKVIDDKIIKEDVELNNNGDFQNKENIEILKYCDIVITNPPFSLFRNLYKILLDNKKQFIIIGSNKFLTNNNKNLNDFINNKIYFNKHKGYYKINYNDCEKDRKKHKHIPTYFYNNIKNTLKNRNIIFSNTKIILEKNDEDNIDIFNKIKDIFYEKNKIFYVPITILEYNLENIKILKLNKQIKSNKKAKFDRILIQLL